MIPPLIKFVNVHIEAGPLSTTSGPAYRINPATAAKGVSRLVSDGILYKFGMFVARGAGEAVRQRRKAAFYDGYVKPLVKEGAFLSLTGEELIAMLEQAIGEERVK